MVLLYMAMLLIWAELVPAQFQRNVFTTDGHVQKRLDEAKETKNVDVLFLGSSHTFRGFDTRIFQKAGLKSFNLGSPAQTPLQTEYLLEQYLDKLKPKLVIYEVYPITFSIDGVEASVHLMANEEVNSDIVEVAVEQNSLIVYNTLLLSSLEQLLGLEIKDELAKKNERYIPGGYVERNLEYFDRTPRPKQALRFDEEQFEWFERNLQLLKARNIDYILVQAPYPKATYNSFTNLEGFDKRMEDYGEYYNFNEAMNLDDSLNYMDDSHLNQNGVNAFNKQLIDTIKRRKPHLSFKL
jgi:hypothetical protein